jgi:potassium-transporting ATPase potassium-binding subunit
MTWIGLCQFLVFVGLLLSIVRPLGTYMAKVFTGKPTVLSKALLPAERAVYRLCRVNPEADQTWTTYAGACLAFGLVNFLVFYLLLRLQGVLPLNPQHFSTSGAPAGAVRLTPDLAFNIAVSFMTNTSWQSYPGEMTLSYLSQMMGIAAQSFIATATGMAVAVALIRGFEREKSRGVGNFWVDVTRCTLYILVPFSFLAGLVLCSLGVIQNLRPYHDVTSLERGKQVIAVGPVASQESIKLISAGDGGGFFNANSAHPYENPTPVTNLIELLLILAIPAAMTYTFGRMIRDQRQGWNLFAVMIILLAAGNWIICRSEQKGNPLLAHLAIDGRASATNPGGNMEGKEVRFGNAASAIFSAVSTASSDGAVNSMHSSFTPLGGLIQMFNLTTGEVIFGGTGTGIISMLRMVLFTVFISGLMIGRTPEYLGKKIEAREMKMVMVSYVANSAPILMVAAAAFLVHFHVGGYWNPPGPIEANLANHGPHGLTEILYANASAVATNGSSFAGLNANTPWFNLTLGFDMLIGRFLSIIPALAIAGSLVGKQRIALTNGTLPTDRPLFAGLLLGAIVLVTSLAFLPAFSLGPIVEHFLMNQGVTFP